MRTNILPDKDGRTLRGVSREFGDASDPGQDGYEFIFARDGSWLEMDNHAPDSYSKLGLVSGPRPRLLAAEPPPEIAGRLPDSDRLAAFRFQGGDWVIVSSTGDSIGAFAIHSDGELGQSYLMGRRERCDRPDGHAVAE
jgi:hypothetical protein